DGTNGDDVIILPQLDAARSASRPAHGSRILLVEANRQPVVRGDEDALRPVGKNDVEQLIAFVDIDRDDSIRANVLKVSQRRLLDHALARDHHDIASFRKLTHWHNTSQPAI